MAKAQGATFTRNIILIGETNSGKTCMIRRFVNDSFIMDNQNTIGMDYCKKLYRSQLPGIEGHEYGIKFWDTAGMERFRNLTSAFYKKADGVIICYDTTDTKSFERVQFWLESICKNCKKEVPVILVGTKTDLTEDRKIAFLVAKQKARELGAAYFECSALADTGVTQAFTFIMDKSILFRAEEHALLDELAPQTNDIMPQP